MKYVLLCNKRIYPKAAIDGTGIYISANSLSKSYRYYSQTGYGTGTFSFFGKLCLLKDSPIAGLFLLEKAERSAGRHLFCQMKRLPVLYRQSDHYIYFKRS